MIRQWQSVVIFLLIILPVMLTLGSLPAAADFNRALAAADRGDYQTAVREFEECAHSDNVLCQYNLGLSYSKGVGVLKDDSKAHYWFERAARLGDMQAQFRAGEGYELGLGIKKNLPNALFLYQQAEAQGSQLAPKKARQIISANPALARSALSVGEPEGPHFLKAVPAIQPSLSGALLPSPDSPRSSVQDAPIGTSTQNKAKLTEERDEIAASVLLFLAACWLFLLIQGLRHKLVIYRSGSDALVCLIVPVLTGVGAFALHAAETRVLKGASISFFLSALVCTVAVFTAAAKDNRSLLWSVPVGLFKLTFVWVVVWLIFLPPGAAQKKVERTPSRVNWIFVGLCGWILYQLINKEEVWQEKGWDVESQPAQELPPIKRLAQQEALDWKIS